MLVTLVLESLSLSPSYFQLKMVSFKPAPKMLYFYSKLIFPIDRT